MFASINERALPDDALLQRYVDSGDYTDCFATDIDVAIGFPQFVEAFYTTAVFRVERLILKWLASRPSTDEEAADVAGGSSETFAAWSVQDRADNQLLLIDMHGRTCSWFMVAPRGDGSRLYFGSAVIRSERTPTGREMKRTYRSLLGFHRLYSRILLSAARSRILRRLG